MNLDTQAFKKTYGLDKDNICTSGQGLGSEGYCYCFTDDATYLPWEFTPWSYSNCEKWYHSNKGPAEDNMPGATTDISYKGPRITSTYTSKYDYKERGAAVIGTTAT